MNSATSSNFFLRLWCTSTPFYPKRAIYSVHLNDASVGDFLKRSNFFIDENQKVVLTCLRLETRSKIYYFWSFTMHSITSSSSFSRPWCTSTPLFSKRARLSVPLWFILGGFFEINNFFTDETKKVVLTCLRLETGSNNYYFWNITMHSLSSSILFFRPWCTSTPFDCKRARCSVHLSDSSGGDILKRSTFFIDETKKLVLTCLRLETHSNNHFFWSFIMHSKSSSNFFLRPWCTSTPLFSKRARYSVHLSDSSMGEILKRSEFFTNEIKKWF